MIPNERMRRELEADFAEGRVLSYTPCRYLLDHECHECAYYEKAGVCDLGGGDRVPVHPHAHRCSKFKASYSLSEAMKILTEEGKELF